MPPPNFELPFPASPLAATRVATLAPLTYLDNLEVGEDGAIYAVSRLDGRLWLVPFDGEPRPLAQVDGRAASVASAPTGGWFVFGTMVDGTTTVFEVDPDGGSRSVLDLPECVHPNGVQRFPDGRYLLADSFSATIWAVDPESRAYAPWLCHPALAQGPPKEIPGVNGIKVFGDALFFTNTGQGTIGRVVLRDGEPAGEPEIVLGDLGVDDFAFDAEGRMYLTTHPFNAVVRRDLGGELTIVAGFAEGVKGCTACRFGRRAGDETGLYVTADGGMFNPEPGGVEEARIVRLETGVAGAAVDL